MSNKIRMQQFSVSSEGDQIVLMFGDKDSDDFIEVRLSDQAAIRMASRLLTAAARNS